MWFWWWARLMEEVCRGTPCRAAGLFCDGLHRGDGVMGGGMEGWGAHAELLVVEEEV